MKQPTDELFRQGYGPGRTIVPVELLTRAPEKVQAVFAEVIPLHVFSSYAERGGSLYVAGYAKAWGPDPSPHMSAILEFPLWRPIFDDSGLIARWVKADGEGDWRWVTG